MPSHSLWKLLGARASFTKAWSPNGNIIVIVTRQFSFDTKGTCNSLHFGFGGEKNRGRWACLFNQYVG
ncbi:hypothetical protein I7I53_03863 [Histoplasma capsulatum var. duboisii H88]|uniref:Uncharacterized protein n=1 Tax=Ajellomyces capsulatus (strain H88) TaxID=544711 RepID=A0A8A1LPE4_AJEC8|nr:hypothetical protein I7I53_03863 [Histoplasma capsulatum var. duboisii H88]